MKITISLALSLALAVASVTCAQAADFSKLMESFGGSSTGWQEFDRDKTSLAAAVDAAQASGQLSKQQADEFRQQIEALNQQETQVKARGGMMSFVQSISFNKQLNALAAQVETAISQGKVTTVPDVAKLQLDLKARIDVMVKQNKLNETDASAIRQQLSHIASMETAFKTESNGPLSARQAELLLVEINKVKTRLDQEDEIADSGVRTLEFRRQRLEKKIADALRQSRLSQSDAQSLSAELAKNTEMQKGFLAASPKLTGGQLLELAAELDKVSTNIDAKLASSPAPSTVPADVTAADDLFDRFARVDQRITRLSSSGRLSAQDADEARRNLDQLTDQYFALKRTNPVLTPAQLNNLNSEFDLLLRRVDESRAPINAAYGGGRYAGRDGSGRNGGPDTGRGGGRGPRPDGGGRNPRGSGRDGQVGGQDPDLQNPPVQTNVSHSPSLSFPVIANKEFTDINGYWAQPYISELANRGVIGGFPNGTFRPEANITRAQFAAIAAQALKLPAASGANFTDVKPGYWAAPVIGAAANAGLIGGFPDGTFKPEDNLTRAQALVILSKALKETQSSPESMSNYKDAQAVPAWATQSVTQAASAHIIVSFPQADQIRPNALTTRGEVAGLMYQTLSALGADLPRINIGVVAP